MKYIRCNLVGMDCKFIVKGETDQEIIDQYNQHLKEVHGTDPEALKSTIEAAIVTR